MLTLSFRLLGFGYWLIACWLWSGVIDDGLAVGLLSLLVFPLVGAVRAMNQASTGSSLTGGGKTSGNTTRVF